MAHVYSPSRDRLFPLWFPRYVLLKEIGCYKKIEIVETFVFFKVVSESMCRINKKPLDIRILCRDVLGRYADKIPVS
jgi:hypothetical protein